MSRPVQMLLRELPPYQGRQTLLKGHQNTYDIIEEILRKHRDWQKHYDKICLDFWKGSPEATANALYTYAKQNIPYKVEPAHKQTVKSPAAILSERFDFGNDCKHYASFIVGVADALRRLGYPVNAFYRFASYDKKRKAPGHVFAVFSINGKEVWVDPVPQIGGFNNRKAQPAFIVDKKPHMGGIGSLYEISGLSEQYLSGMPGEEIISGRKPRFGRNLDPREHRKKIQMLIRRNKPRFLPMPPGLGDGPEGEIGKRKGPKKKKGFLKNLKIKAPKLKPGKFLMKFGGAPSRNAFLLLVKLNTFKLATKMWQKAAKDKNSANWKKLAAAWTKLGGKPDKLYREIQRGVNTYNKLHKSKKRITGIGYGEPDDMGEYISGIDEGVGEVYDMIGAYHDDMSVGDIICFVHQNHSNRMRRAHRRRGSMGAAPAVAAAGVIAAAAPIIKALMNILKSFGINTKKADDTAAADADAVAKEFNEQEVADGEGTVYAKDGKEMELKEDPTTGKQKIIVKKAPGLSDGESDDADEPTDEEGVKTKTKTITKTKTWTGDGDEGEVAAGFLDTVKNFIGEHKKYFIWGGVAIVGLIVIPKVFRAVTGPKTRRRR